MVVTGIAPITRLTLVATVSIAGAVNAQETLLRVEASLYQSRVADRCPLIVTLGVVNTGAVPVRERFSSGSPNYLVSNASLVLTGTDGRVYELNWDGGQPDEGMYAPVHTLHPNQWVRVDWILPTVVVTRDKHRGRHFDFIPTGDYTGRVRVLIMGGTIESNEFTLTIEAPTGDDAAARDLITVTLAALLQGKASALSYADYLGERDPMKGASHARYEEVEHILTEYPESPYAEWIRFWKLLYALDGEYQQSREDRCEAAIRYADGRPDFPLSDNLKFEAARRLTIIGKNARAREVTAELLRDFPDSDTRPQAKKLQEKLAKKP